VIVVSEQVRQALADRVPVVAMESTIFSTLGLPVPHNAEALRAARPRSRRAAPSPPSRRSSTAGGASA
jgi:pseudouridine-5'-phosphate glycosidase